MVIATFPSEGCRGPSVELVCRLENTRKDKLGSTGVIETEMTPLAELVVVPF